VAVAPQIARAAALLPIAPHEATQLGGPTRPWVVRYGTRTAVLRFSDPERLRRLRIAPEVARSSIVWLHAFLADLERVGFVAPAPVRDLDGDSIAVVDGVIWELLTFVPGGAVDWSDPDMRAAGALLARFHDASRRTPVRGQRPGALPIIDCRPAHSDARRVRAVVERELAVVGYDAAPRAVVHGDATQANVVIDEGTYRLVDYALAYVEPLLFDIGSALWRNGRTHPNSLDYDPRRAAEYVRGYHTVRPLATSDAKAIVAYMLARGLQIQERLERREGRDDTVIGRLLSVERQADVLRETVEQAIDSGS
jgi:Ser/Thr protein kinase RdoA (MazF antagonist)